MRRLYVKDIIDAMDAIEKFVEGMIFEDFINDENQTNPKLVIKRGKHDPR